MSDSLTDPLAPGFDSAPIEPGSGPRPREVPSAATGAAPAAELDTKPAPEPLLTCPSCGFEQPAADECLKCGLVVAKYRARGAAPPPPGAEAMSSDEIAADLAAQGYEPRERRFASEEVDDDGFFAPEQRGLAKGMMGGIVMMGIAVVWFGLGWAAGYIFFYPPILFVIGLFGFLKGLFTGNVAGG